MRPMRASFFATGLVLALSSAALWAQEGGGRRGGGGARGFGAGNFTVSKAILVGSEQVKKELKITEEQGKKLEPILAAYREAQRGLGGRGNRDASEEERKKAREEAQKKTAELNKETDAKLVAVLDKPQNERLDQIHLQQQGADGLVAENVVAALKLSEEQVKKIKGTFATRDEELGKLRGGFGRGGGGGGGGNFQEIREKSDKLRKDAETAALALLSKEQTEAFTKLKGTAFELDRQALFGGRGGFGGGGGRGGAPGGPGGGGAERKRPPEDDSK